MNRKERQLVDQFGAAQAEYELAKRQYEELRDAIMKVALSRETDTLDSGRFTVKLSVSSRVWLNAERIRDEMPEDWVTEHEKEKTVVTVRVTMNAEARRAA